MRKLQPEMLKYLDSKLLSNGAAQEAIRTKDARSLFVYAAEACVGIREATGDNDGPMVELLQKTIGSANGEAWCMSYMQTCLAYAEAKTGVVSPIFASEHCMTVWQKTGKTQRVRKIPAKGAIAIWNYPPSANGHTGVVLEYGHAKNKMRLCEGNTTSGLRADGTIERDGGGCYLTERSTVSGKKMVLLGFLKPF